MDDGPFVSDKCLLLELPPPTHNPNPVGLTPPGTSYGSLSDNQVTLQPMRCDYLCDYL